MKMAVKWQKYPEIGGIAKNGLKVMKVDLMAGNGCIRLETPGNGWKWFEMADNDWKWME